MQMSAVSHTAVISHRQNTLTFAPLKPRTQPAGFSKSIPTPPAWPIMPVHLGWPWPTASLNAFCGVCSVNCHITPAKCHHFADTGCWHVAVAIFREVERNSPMLSCSVMRNAIQIYVYYILRSRKYKISPFNSASCLSRWPRVLRRRSAAAHLLELRVRIPPGAWMSVVSVVCCQVEVSATSQPLVQKNPTDCGVSLCVIVKPR